MKKNGRIGWIALVVLFISCAANPEDVTGKWVLDGGVTGDKFSEELELLSVEGAQTFIWERVLNGAYVEFHREGQWSVDADTLGSELSLKLYLNYEEEELPKTAELLYFPTSAGLWISEGAGKHLYKASGQTADDNELAQ